MKRRIIFIVFGILTVTAVIILLLCTVFKEKKLSNNIEYETGFGYLLEQKHLDYLVDFNYIPSEYDPMEELNSLTYEELNMLFLGTGFELYNQSSGFEKFGCYYSYGEDVDVNDYGHYYTNRESTSEKCISIEEAYEIREKDMDMRLEDFFDFKYEIFDEGNVKTYELPVEGYGYLYLVVSFIENEDGTVHIKRAPGFESRIPGNFSRYSLLCGRTRFDTCYNMEPRMTDTDKLGYGIQYTSVTDKTLVIEFFNWFDKVLYINNSHVIYKKDGNEYVKLDQFTYETDYYTEVSPMLYVTYLYVNYNEAKDSLEPGDYKLVLDEDDYNLEFEFTVE